MKNKKNNLIILAEHLGWCTKKRLLIKMKNYLKSQWKLYYQIIYQLDIFHDAKFRFSFGMLTIQRCCCYKLLL